MTLKELPISFDFVLGNEKWRKAFTQFLQELKDPVADASVLKLYLTVLSIISNPGAMSIVNIMKSLHNTYFTKSTIGYLSDELRHKFGETLERRVYNESIFVAVKHELRPLLEGELFPKFVQSELFKARYREEMQKSEPPVQDDAIAPAFSAASKTSSSSIGGAAKPERYSIRTSKRAMHNSFSNGQEVFIDEFAAPPAAATEVASSTHHHFAKPNSSLSYSALDSKYSSSRTSKHMKSPSSSSVASSTASNVVAGSSRHASSSKSSSTRTKLASAKNSACNKSIISLNENQLSEQLSKSTANAASYSAKNQSMLNLNLSSSTAAGLAAHVPSRGASIGPISTQKTSTSTSGVVKMPPNPYHVPTRPVPISAQDSEIQSMVSVDALSRHDRHASKVFEEFGPVDGKHHKSHHGGGGNPKKPAIPLAQENPQQFYEQTCAKLSECLARASQDPSLEPGMVHLHPCPVTEESTLPLETDYGPNQFESDLSVGLSNMRLDESSKMKDRLGSGAILDDHLSRVEKHLEASQASNSNKMNTSLSNQKPHYGMNLINNMLKKTSPKFNNSINSAKSRLGLMSGNSKSSGGASKDKSQSNHTQDSNLDLTLVSSNIDMSQASIKTSDFNQSASMSQMHASYSMSKFNTSSGHHQLNDSTRAAMYYQYGQSKEVDIDKYEQKLRNAVQHNASLSHHYQQHSAANRSHHEPARSSNKTVASEMQHPMPSSKHDRVSDWLASGGYHTSSSSYSSAPLVDKPEAKQLQPNSRPSSGKLDKPEPLKPEPASAVKTTVAYYLPGEELPYMTSVQTGGELTLAKFKQLVSKKGQFRYFFKTTSDLLGEVCAVFQEITDESSVVPTFQDKVIAKIMPCENRV